VAGAVPGPGLAAYDRALARRGDHGGADGRAVFRLALRQVEGLIASIFALLGAALPAPDHTTPLSARPKAAA
jgi:hypothetical protein